MSDFRRGRPRERSAHVPRRTLVSPAREPMRPSPHCSSLRRSTVPWPSPGPRQERPVRRQVSWLAGQGSMHAFPGLAW